MSMNLNEKRYERKTNKETGNDSRRPPFAHVVGRSPGGGKDERINKALRMWNKKKS